MNNAKKIITWENILILSVYLYFNLFLTNKAYFQYFDIDISYYKLNVIVELSNLCLKIISDILINIIPIGCFILNYKVKQTQIAVSQNHKFPYKRKIWFPTIFLGTLLYISNICLNNYQHQFLFQIIVGLTYVNIFYFLSYFVIYFKAKFFKLGQYKKEKYDIPIAIVDGYYFHITR